MLQIEESEFKTSKDYFRKADQIYFMMIAPSLALFIYAFFEWNNHQEAIKMPVQLSSLMTGIVVIITTIIGVLNYLYYRKCVKEIGISGIENTKSKMIVYYTLNIKYYGTIQVLGFAMVLSYYFTGVIPFMQLYVFTLFYTAMEKMTANRLSRQLRFNKSLYEKIYRGELL